MNQLLYSNSYSAKKSLDRKLIERNKEKKKKENQNVSS